MLVSEWAFGSMNVFLEEDLAIRELEFGVIGVLFNC